MSRHMRTPPRLTAPPQVATGPVRSSEGRLSRRDRLHERHRADLIPPASEEQRIAILAQAKQNVDKAIKKLKLKGKDAYDREDIVRIYLRYYPRWSDQYIRKEKELGKVKQSKARKEAYQAHQAALKEKVEVGIFTIQTDKGPKTFEAVDADQAKRKAELYGLEVKSVSESGTKTLTGVDAAKRISTARSRGVLDEAEAVVAYGSVLGYDVPKDSVPIRIEGRYQFLDKADVDKLIATPAYQNAKGDVSDKLKAAYDAVVKAFGTIGPHILTFVSGLFGHGVVAAQDEGVPYIRATAEELEKIENVCPGGVCPAEISELHVYRITASGGQVVYVEALDERTAKKKATDAGYTVGWITESDVSDFTFQETIDIPNLVEDVGVTNATEVLQNVGVTNATELIDAYQEGKDEYEEFQEQVESGNILSLPDGTYITKEEFNQLPQGTQDILKKSGFEGLAIAKEMLWEKGARPMGIGAKPEARKALWDSLPDTITQAQYKSLSVNERTYYNPAKGYETRALTMLAIPFAPPVKAVLPEYNLADVTATEWALAGANVALLPIAFAPGTGVSAVATATRSAQVAKGIGIVASGVISGVTGYETAKNWDELSNLQRGIGIGVAALCAIPILTTVARNVKIASSPAIPTVKGDIVAWKGLSVAGHPIIGRSGGKWILGTRNLTIPEATLILNGYHPQMMLETKVFVNRASLTKAGFTKTQIDYLIGTLKTRNLFAGKSSPWLDADVLIEPTQRLNSKEIDVILNHITQKQGQVKNATYLYGSPTIKAQAAPELRNWRPIHDWDISVTGSQTQVDDFVRSLLDDLRTNGGGTYRINPKSPMLIEKKLNGQWTHIADIHAYDIASVEIPASKLDSTGSYSYGRMVSEPAITVNYPGRGKVQIMRLSETGVRKTDTILRVRQTPQGTAFKPPARGIAQPGVPKDAADFYVTVRTLVGESVAEDWLSLWAKAMGYTDDQLRNVLPRIRQSMIEVAANTPSDIIGYRFIPAKTPRISVGASPSISVHIPSSLGASVSPSIAKVISQPVYPYQSGKSPSTSVYASTALYSLMSQSASGKIPSLSVSPTLAVISRGIPSGIPSKYIPIKPSPTPSASPSQVPSKGVTPSPIPSPSPAPSPSPYPVPSPTPMMAEKPKRPFLVVSKGKKQYKIPDGSLAWKQGIVWKYIPSPWTQQKPISLKYPPVGAIHVKEVTPQNTIQIIGKKKARVPKSASIDLGVVDIKISNYGKSITFTGGGEETIAGGGVASTTKGMSIPATAPTKLKGYNKLAFGTSLRSLVTETYRDDIPKKFAEKALASKLSKLSPKQIADELRESGVSRARINEILKRVPDRVRKQVELWLSMAVEYAPTRGFPKMQYQPSVLRRKKKVDKTVLKEEELVASASSMRT